MSPTSFCPGAVAVKSRLIRSGMSARLAACLVVPLREASWLAGHQIELAHQVPHHLRVAADAPAGQLGVDAPVPVPAVAVGERLDDHWLEPVPPLRGRRRRPVQPLVVSRNRYLQPLTHLLDRVPSRPVAAGGGLLRVDELVPSHHRRSFAKKAAAFARNSFSSFSSRFSRSNSRNRARSETVNGSSSWGCAFS